ncbi:acetyltransferase, GNAT family [Pediococcus damnosus]|uniref:Acetyltransferase, GNAT family n=1 Tax=Pediococcus damnosus TaxID=51663 RepID=A0A0R2HRP7_9LACO|nr:GNAT family N-acetyltransferase [Pediococcus damnosus]AMV60911.1 acetyltransferase, GNAT family [Pediococcus damnosus]AMV63478.1 acetyltransferase, GNAT family [Pediococcus damnosus]AMV65271.1 acetyltransferase, GNAT family [Pediococcus damnosus]AMV66587.1 acetyltransferase, GNAT family [Pediococcus damnosus]AMV68876.1 acetyltransferase, GNAT family [Pediococcus damnosus]
MKIKSAYGNNGTVYEDGMEIRKSVFIEEQNIDPSIEQDENESRCRYYVGYVNQAPVTTARVMRTDEGTLVQRVCTIKAFRHQGLSSQILQAIEKDAKGSQSKAVWLFAQDQAQKFYLNNGYTVVGDKIMEAGIPHHKMVKEF